MKFAIGAIVVIAVVAGAFAQSNTGTSNWEVLATWGQLPAGTPWGAASQVATTAEGQIIVFRRMVRRSLFSILTEAL